MGYGVLDRAEVTRTKKLTWLGQTFYSEAIMTEPLKFTVDGKDRYFCRLCRRPMFVVIDNEDLFLIICGQFDPNHPEPHSFLKIERKPVIDNGQCL